MILISYSTPFALISHLNSFLSLSPKKTPNFNKKKRKKRRNTYSSPSVSSFIHPILLLLLLDWIEILEISSAEFELCERKREMRLSNGRLYIFFSVHCWREWNGWSELLEKKDSNPVPTSIRLELQHVFSFQSDSDNNGNKWQWNPS